MNLPDAITVAVPTTALTAIAPFVIRWIQSRMLRRERYGDVTPVDLPKRTDSSDAKFRAVSLEGFARIESLHEALGKKSDTGGFIILEMFKSLVQSMNRQTEILGEQTTLLRQIAGSREMPRPPDGRYKGGG